MSDPYYQPKAHVDAQKQSETGHDRVKERKQITTTWGDLMGIGKDKKQRRTESGIDDNS